MLNEERMHRKIQDEFTDLPISKQRKHQLRRKKGGKCILCGKPLVFAFRCLDCQVAFREYIRKRNGAIRRNNSQTYKLQQEKR